MRYILFIFLAQFIVGLNIVTSKFLIKTIPPLVLLEIRFILATCILFCLYGFQAIVQQKISKNYISTLKRRDWFYVIAQALCGGLLFNVFMLTGLHYTDANVAGIITSALPALIAMLFWLLLKDKISSQKMLCIIFATLGLLFIAFEKFQGHLKFHSYLGDGMVFLALLPEATYYILCRQYQPQLPIFLSSFLMNVINAIVLLPIFFMTHWEPSSLNFMNGVILAFLGLNTGLFFVFWLTGAKHVDGVLTSLSTAMMPLSTTLLAWVFLGEHLTPLELMGMTLVLLSIFFSLNRSSLAQI